MNLYDEALKAHKEWKGKIKQENKAPIDSREELSVAYTPGVAAPCLAIKEDREKVYDYTWKGNLVAVITDGSAVLGLGDIGAEASLPVMEGKCALFNRFAGLNAVPILLDTKDEEEIIKTITHIAPSFGGINLEDISAPRCVRIERELQKRLSIPVFHDDQHGTSIVLGAALINSLKLVKKDFKDIKVTMIGTGAAGSSIIKMLYAFGVRDIYAFNSRGVIRGTYEDELLNELSDLTNPRGLDVSLEESMMGSDVFIGVSAPGLITKEMVKSMNDNAMVFSMANPEPEISYLDAKEAGARVVGTGRSDAPNQVNNLLAFPGLLKGAMEARVQITDEIKMEASRAIAKLIGEDELRDDYVIVDPAAGPVRVVGVTVRGRFDRQVMAYANIHRQGKPN